MTIMNKVQNANVELHNITKVINFVLFAESTEKEDKQFIFDQINKIFSSDVSEHSFINDMPWTDPTMKQMDQLKGLIEELQERYVIGSEGPCMECGKYFMPGERIYRMGDGDYMCKKCRDRKFKTERAWSEYNVMVNAGGDPDKIGDCFDPTWNIIHHLDDDELDTLAEKYSEEADAEVYETTASM